MRIDNGGHIKLLEVDAEVQLDILLSHYDHGGCPRTVKGANNATVQHLLHLFSFLPQQSRVLLAVWKPYQWPLCFARVLDHRDLPEVFIMAAENVPVLLQQLFQLTLLYWGQKAGDQLAKIRGGGGGTSCGLCRSHDLRSLNQCPAFRVIGSD